MIEPRSKENGKADTVEKVEGNTEASERAMGPKRSGAEAPRGLRTRHVRKGFAGTWEAPVFPAKLQVIRREGNEALE